jgi:hypothetical protein
VCVTKPLHPDLDAEALAVNVLVTIELTFTLR